MMDEHIASLNGTELKIMSIAQDELGCSYSHVKSNTYLTWKAERKSPESVSPPDGCRAENVGGAKGED